MKFMYHETSKSLITQKYPYINGLLVNHLSKSHHETILGKKIGYWIRTKTKKTLFQTNYKSHPSIVRYKKKLWIIMGNNNSSLHIVIFLWHDCYIYVPICYIKIHRCGMSFVFVCSQKRVDRLSIILMHFRIYC